MTSEKSHDDFKSGFISFVGRPNAGKSTIVNAILGKKVAITSNTVQTTRHRFRAVYTKDNFQLIMVDTPGLHKAGDALGDHLNASALKSLEDVDIVAMVVDATKEIGTGDIWVSNHVQATKAVKILILNKLDLVSDELLQNQLNNITKLGDFDKVICVSAITGENVEKLIELVQHALPRGPLWFPVDMETDQPLEVMIAEFVREKILRNFHDEVPHAIGVVCEEMQYDRRKDLYRIFCDIFVERDSQKGMIIGSKGASIKEIGSSARIDLELLLGCRVFMDLRVKVKKNWRRDLNQIKRFGYGEGQ